MLALLRSGAAHRVLRVVLATVLALGGLAVLDVVRPTAAQAADAFECTSSNVYLIEADGDVFEVNGSTGAASATAVYNGDTNGAGAKNVSNQLGISNAGVTAVNTNTDNIAVRDQNTGTTSQSAKNTSAGGTTGAVNPATNTYYYGGYTTTNNVTTITLYGYDIAKKTAFGPAATITVPDAPGGNGDIAFDKKGRIYLVASAAANATNPTSSLYVANVTLPTSGTTPVTATAIPISTASTGGTNGIAFAADGFLYLSTASSITKVNPITGATVATNTFSGNAVTTSRDLASCAYPSLMTVRKNLPDGRIVSTDQFATTIRDADYNSVPSSRQPNGLTAGNETGIQDQTAGEQAGPSVVLPGRTYTIKETGDGSTDQTKYVSSYQCVDNEDGGKVIASSKGPNGYDGRSGDITMPTTTSGSDVVCTITNAAPVKTVTVQQSVSSPTYNAADQTLTYTTKVTNTGNVPLSDLSISNSLGLSGFSCGPVANGGTLAAGDTTTCTGTRKVTQDDLDNARDLTNTVSVSGTSPAAYDSTPVTGSATATSKAAPASAISVTTTPNPATVSRAGQQITYTFEVTNNGNQTLSDVQVTDPMSGLSTITCTPVPQGGSLAPGQTTTCTATYTTTDADVNGGGPILTTATAAAKNPAGQAVSGDGGASVKVATIAPSATNDTATTLPGKAVALEGATNDSPGEAGGPAIDPSKTVFSDGSKSLTTAEGTWVIRADGTVLFTPKAGYSGTTAPVTYRITDAAGKTATATLTVTVQPGPQAVADTPTTKQNQTLTFSPTANDKPGKNVDGSDATIDTSTVRFPETGQPSGGTVSENGTKITVQGQGVYTINASGVVTFVPETAFTGPASAIVYTFSDVNGTTGSSTITVGVDAVTPRATNDSANTPFNTAVTLEGERNDSAGDPSAPLDVSKTVFTSTEATAGGKKLATDEGDWEIQSNGSVRFTPTRGYSSTTPAVTYRITDANGSTATATLRVTVRPGPSAMADSIDTKQNVPGGVRPAANDTPGEAADGSVGSFDPASVRLTDAGLPNGSDVSADGKKVVVPNEGTYTVDPTTGRVEFAPETAFTGPATPVTYQVTDSFGNITSSTITARVSAVTPVATSDADRTPADTPVTLPAATNDIPGDQSAPIDVTKTIFPVNGQPSGSTVTIDGKTLENTQGTWVLGSDGKATFTPATGFTSTTDPVTYRITDANGTTATATLTVGVGAGALARPDEPSTKQNRPLTVGVLDNDLPAENADGTPGSFDPTSLKLSTAGLPAGSTVTGDGRTLTVPNEGTYTVDASSGEVTFTPVPAFNGPAHTVTYSVDSVAKDSGGNPVRQSVSSTITFRVSAVTPSAKNESGFTTYDTLVVLPGSTTATSSDPSATIDDTLTVFTASQVSSLPTGSELSGDGKTLTVAGEGIWTIAPDGTVQFDPAVGFASATTPVTYQVSDTNGTTATGQLGVIVRPGPVAQKDGDSTTTPQNTPVVLDVLANDLPGRNSDGSAGSLDKASVQLTTAGLPAGSTVTGDGKQLTVPNEGVYTVDPATGEVTFAPTASFSGKATPVTYTARDTVTDSTGKTVHNPLSSTLQITVAAVVPTATNDTAFTPYGTAVTLLGSTNDNAGSSSAPIDDSATVFPATGQPSGASVSANGKTLTLVVEGVWTIAPDGTIEFTPESGFVRATSKPVYQITDANGTKATATLAVTVRSGPTAASDSDTTPQNTSVTLDVLSNDSAGQNADGSAGALDPTSVRFPTTGQPNNATVSTDARGLTVPGEGAYAIDPTTGKVTFTPEAAFSGKTSTIAYTAQDSVTDSAGKTVHNSVGSTLTITVASVQPVATNDTATTPYGVAVRIPILGNDKAGSSAAQLDPASVRLQLVPGLPAGSTLSTDAKTLTVAGQGTYAVDAQGVVTFTPARGFTGQAAPIGYQVSDANGTAVSATVTVTVTAAGKVKPDATTAKPGKPVTVDVLANDAPPVGEQWVPSSVCLVPNGVCVKSYTKPKVGTWVVNPDGTITFTPVKGFHGTATVAYSVTDTAGEVYSSTMTVKVPRSGAAVTAAPASSSSDPALPNTGGPQFAFLLAGVLATLLGLVLVLKARKPRYRGRHT